MTTPRFDSLDQMAAATAGMLADAAAHAAFRLFRDRTFRRLAAFDSLDQGEQDRIFNELVVSWLVLVMLMLEAPDLGIDDDMRPYLGDVSKHIPKAHVGKLRELGIEDEHLRIWDKLIDMRYQEYARDRHGVRAAAMKIEAADKELGANDFAKIQLCVPVQAVAIGCHHHVCRGRTEGRDELFKLLVRSLGRFYVEIRVRFEGGRITLLTRVRVALNRFFRRLLRHRWK
ncbi:hypothetical protein GX586_14955 [bacterium]|nr:hypothetical protein [bacterium]